MADNTDSGWRERFIKDGWIPPSRDALNEWLTPKEPKEPGAPKKPYLHSAVQELKRLIDDDPEVYMGFHDMLEEHSSGGPTGSAMPYTSPPAWDKDNPAVILTINIVSSIAVTEFGFATFMNPKVNAVFKKILDAWTRYLLTPASASVLTTDGWLSKEAMSKLSEYLPAGETPTEQFKKAFVRPPNYDDKTWGFESWDNFFTRRFIDIDKTRPLPTLDDPDVIVNACDSRIYKINPEAKEDGKFWLKTKEYSLRMMLNDDEFAPRFYNGTVYQAYLSVWDYHRWHSPVNGIVRKVINVPGAYYAVPPDF